MSFTTRVSNNVIKVSLSGGRLTGGTAVTLKNQINELNSIEDLGDVVGTNVTDGATLIYNSANDKYEIKPLSIGDLGDLDGGLF
jgi:hypothetical protein